VRRIVIIGFGSAGYAALMAAKKKDPSAEITVVDPKDHDLMHPCGLPYSLEGLLAPESLLQEIQMNKMNVRKIKGKALRRDPAKKELFVDGGSGDMTVPWDSVVIAPGARPYMPPVPGLAESAGKGLYPLTTVEELRAIESQLETAKRAVVIGAGAIGLEAAAALRHRGLDVRLLEMRDQVLPGVMDADMAKTVQEYLEGRGVGLMLGAPAGEILFDGAFCGVRSGETVIKADLGILAAGFVPATEIAEQSGLEYGRSGIAVNNAMLSSAADVYAAGDCAAGWSVIDGKPFPAKLATGAYRQGLVAGANAAGDGQAWQGTTGTFVTRLGDLEIAGTGFTQEEAARRGFDPVAGKIKTGILPHYFPGNTEIAIKILCDRSSGKILGAQALGFRGAAERINLVGMAIEFGLSPEELGRVETAYCPAVSEVVDPLHKALEFLLRRMRK